jgi:hypothetical protein
MDDQSSRSAAPSISEAESEAARSLEPRLRDYLQINSDVYNFVGLCLAERQMLVFETWPRHER